MPDSPTKTFSGIFVSYRRDDSSGHAGRLFDRLVSHFGKDRVFMDIDTIDPGEDFVTVIENAVGSCEILITVIGRQWLSSAEDSSRRLDNPHDFVRLEIATALSRDIRVIPVLVQRASMPKPQDLPDDLVKFSRRNAIELSDLRWQSDVSKLVSVLERRLAQRTEEKSVQAAAAVQLLEAANPETEKTRGEEDEAADRAKQERLSMWREKIRSKRASEELWLEKEKTPKLAGEMRQPEERSPHKEPDQTSSIVELPTARRSDRTTARSPSNTRPFMNIALWIIQVLLALLFTLFGAVILTRAVEVSAMESPKPLQMPILLLRFLGVCEVFGALGLILPELLRIKPWLTPLAASGLVIIMIGATLVHLINNGVEAAVFPFVTFLLLTFVAYGRSR